MASRAFLIVIKGVSPNTKCSVTLNNNTYLYDLYSYSEEIIVETTDLIISPVELIIKCDKGSLGVGQIKFDKVFIPNPNFNYTEIREKLHDSNYDFSVLNDYELDRIHTQAMFIASKEKEFGGYNDLRINPKINGVLSIASNEYKFPPNRIFLLKEGDIFSCDLTVPRAVL